ncbi:hypothetical protein NMY22_g17016 [Coprinellus aureogranulatus]|nr:hypothetical protein NMY22_g17016 [Coprinellus aureogranulatus]
MFSVFDLLRKYELSSGSVITAWQSLLSLKVIVSCRSTFAPSFPHKAVLSNLPKKLESFALYLGYFHSAPVTPEAIVPSTGHFVRLTSLGLYGVWNPPLTMYILQRCPHLESLKLSVDPREETRDETANEFALSALSTLELVFLTGRRGSCEASRFFRLLRLPALVDLTIDRGDGDTSLKVLESLRLLSPGQVSSLRYLTIKNSSIQTEALIEGLLAIPSLECLTLQYFDLDAEKLHSSELERVAASSETPILFLPQLTSLELRSVEPGFQLPFFLDFIKEREVLHREHRRRMASRTGSVHVNRLQQMRFDFLRWDAKSQELWYKCSNAVRELQSEFGITVERIIRSYHSEEEDVEQVDLTQEL